MSKKTVLYVWGLLFSVVSLNGAENPPKIVITKADEINKLLDARNQQYPKRSRKLPDTLLRVQPHQLPKHDCIPTSINNNTK